MTNSFEVRHGFPYFQKPVQRAVCGNIPVQSYGFTDILAESPDLMDNPRLQVGNEAPVSKVHPKKSWEISNNGVGLAIGRLPRTPENDYLPLEPIHLIDGNPETCWSSMPYPQPDAEPVWIRIDLAMERTINKIVLKKRRPGRLPRIFTGSAQMDPGAVEVGMAMPGELTIKISRDAWHWDTVFEGPTLDAPDRREFEFSFDPRPAKQIWIIGRKLPRVENWDHSFSIANAEVYDTRNQNVALATNGTGVTASSTMHGFGTERDAYPWYWALNYDLGLKWVRLGFHDDVINWHWVEKEKGKLAVDPVADEAVTDLMKNGVNVLMALGFGNRLYTQKDPTRRMPQLWEWYWENPAPPTTPEALEAWGRYVRFMAEHFRDRVPVFEIWNEWNTGGYWGADPSAEDYVRVAKIAIPILRQVAPKSKIMLGAYAGFTYKMSQWTPQEAEAKRENYPIFRVVQALAKDVDMISWHPFYQSPPEDIELKIYAADVRTFQKYCEDQGFQGSYMVSEWAYGASYPPPAEPNWWGKFVCSEMEKAKYVAQITVKHAALGMPSFFCGFCDSYYPLDLSLLRRGFATDPIMRMQPQPVYYVMRNLATALENLSPAEVNFRVEPVQDNIERFALHGNGQTVLALWTWGPAKDSCEGRPFDVTLQGTFAKAFGFDSFNATAQPLNIQIKNNQTRISGILIKDYPILIRLEK
jgi:hypothetical protein